MQRPLTAYASDCDLKSGLNVLGAYVQQSRETIFFQIIACLAGLLALPAHAETTFIWPVHPTASWWISQDYAKFNGLPDNNSWKLKFHSGIDIVVDPGSAKDVCSAAEGDVIIVDRDGGSGWGNYVVVKHDPSVFTVYAHLESVEGFLDQKCNPDSAAVHVGAGQKIGTIGSTGCGTCGAHLHFDVITVKPPSCNGAGLGPGYSNKHPDSPESGPPHRDPKQFFEHWLVEINDRTIAVREYPKEDATKLYDVFEGQRFVALAHSQSDWYLVYCPWHEDDATPPGVADRLYGWIKGSSLTASSLTQCDHFGVDGRAFPEDDSTDNKFVIASYGGGNPTWKKAKLRGGQRFAIAPQEPTIQCESGQSGYRFYIPRPVGYPSSYPLTAWGCIPKELPRLGTPSLGSFSGRAVFSENLAIGMPYSTVTWGNSPPTTTDAFGYFSFNDVPTGTASLKACLSLAWDTICTDPVSFTLGCSEASPDELLCYFGTCDFSGVAGNAFSLGDTVRVVGTSGLGLKGWQSPCSGSTKNRPEGMQGVIVNPLPQLCNGYVRWQIAWSDGEIRWSAQGDCTTGDAWLELVGPNVPPSSLVVTLSPPWPNPADPGELVAVTGTVVKSNGAPVPSATATFLSGGQGWTAPVFNGSVVGVITAPASSGPVAVTVSDGALSGSASTFLAINGENQGSGYEYCCGVTCEDVDDDDPWEPIDPTEAFDADDNRIYAWVRLEDVDVAFRIRWKWYSPDGFYDTYESDWVDDYWDWYHAWSWIPLDNSDNAYLPGPWAVKIYVDTGDGWEFKETLNFVVRYELVEHLMTKGVQSSSPYNPIGPTNIFKQTDAFAYGWTRLEYVSEALELKWEFREPNGSLYATVLDSTEEPPTAYVYWDWYNAWGWIGIDGASAESKCGPWTVSVNIKDPDGQWQEQYTDSFQILESPAVAPTLSVTSTPSDPLPGQAITLFVSAIDNTYLDQVVLYWNDGTSHSATLGQDLFQPTLAASKQIGALQVGQQVVFYATGVDGSGNSTTTPAQTISLPFPPGQYVGAVGGSWTTPSNWAGGSVPSPSTSVVIPAGTSVVIPSGTATASAVELLGDLSIFGGTLDVSGCLDVKADAHLVLDGYSESPAMIEADCMSLAGTLSADIPNAHLSIDGAAAVLPSGTLHLSVSATSSTPLVQASSAALSGSLIVSVNDPDVFPLIGEEISVLSAGLVNGAFTQVDVPAPAELCLHQSSVVTLTVSLAPVAPTSATASHLTVCSGSPTTLTASGGSGTTLHWFSGSCGGIPVGTGNNLVVTPSSTTTYYARWSNACGNSACASVTVTVSPEPVAPTTVSATDGNCDSVTVAWLGDSGATGYEIWRNTSSNQATAQFASTAGSSPYVDTSAAPGTQYWYWVKTTNSCGVSGFSGSDQGSAGATPAAPTSAVASPPNVCDGVDAVTLTVEGGAGETLEWFSGLCEGTPIGIGSPLTIAAPSVSTTYLARWTNPCGLSNCTSVGVVVSQRPAMPPTPIVTQNSCGQASLAFAGSPPADVTWYWQGNACGTSTLLGSAESHSIFQSGTYYLRAKSNLGDCWSDECASVAVTVSQPPDLPPPPIVTSVTCTGAVLSFSGAPPVGQRWYWQGQGCAEDTSLGFDSSISVTSPGVYFLQAATEDLGCWSPGCTGTEVHWKLPCVWVGPIGGAWSDAANWEGGLVPNASTSVLIPTGAHVVVGPDVAQAQFVELMGSLDVVGGMFAVEGMFVGGSLTLSGTEQQPAILNVGQSLELHGSLYLNVPGSRVATDLLLISDMASVHVNVSGIPTDPVIACNSATMWGQLVVTAQNGSNLPVGADLQVIHAAVLSADLASQALPSGMFCLAISAMNLSLFVADPDASGCAEAKLVAVDGEPGELFGFAVDLDGDYAIVGASSANDLGSHSGAAYVFRFDGAIWELEEKLLASDGAQHDRFGYSVSLSGELAVVGASEADAGRGAVYVFRRHADGRWIEETKLSGSVTPADAHFGFTVSASGGTIVVGASQNGDTVAGAVHIFENEGQNWVEVAMLTVPDAGPSRFGAAVAVSGSSAVVGAFLDDEAGENAGAAYIFERGAGDWQMSTKLTASDASPGDLFGKAVSVDGDVALIGALYDKDNGTDSGSAYVFRRAAGDWAEEQKLLASDGAFGDFFSSSVCVSGDVVIVGAELNDDAGLSSGSAYTFAWTGAEWIEQAKLVAFDAAADDRFGSSVAVGGNLILVAAPLDDDKGINAGAAYVFVIESCPADLTGDSIVNATDLALVLGAWGSSSPGDLNGDGLVGAPDLAILLGSWGPCSVDG